MNLYLLVSLSLTFFSGAQGPAARADGQDPAGTLLEAFESLERVLFENVREDVWISLSEEGGGRARELAGERGQRLARELPRRWPTSPRVHVMPAAREAWGDVPDRLLQSGKRLGDGRAAFQLGQAEEYVVLLLAPGAPARIESFRRERGTGRITLNLELPPPGPTGSVVFDVRGPDGGPCRGWLATYIRDRETGLVLLAEEPDPWSGKRPGSEWPPAYDLPVGEYTFVARSRPSFSYHGHPRARSEFGDARLTFRVRAGLHSEFVVRQTRPAYLEVGVKGQVLPEDFAAVRREWRDSGMISILSEHELARQVRLLLRREGEYPRCVEFEGFAYANTDAAGSHILPWLDLRADVSLEISEALTPGRYQLEARLPGGRSLTRIVELIAGETTRVEFDFGSVPTGR